MAISRIEVNTNLLNNTINVESNTRNYWSGQPYNENTNVQIENVIGKITYSLGNRTTGNDNFSSHYDFRNFKGYKQTLDLQNFNDLTGFINYSNYGENYYNNAIKNINIIQPVSAGRIEDQGFVLPKNLTLLKFYVFKQGSRYDLGSGVDMNLKLYMVKNNDLWVDSSSLDLSTDAIEIAQITAEHHKTGYFESNIVYTSNLGNDLRTCNIQDYTEGRYYITTSNTSKNSGVIGITYI